MTDERKLITVRVSDQLHRELRLLAADRDVSLGELCADALKEWREQRPEQVTVSKTGSNATIPTAPQPPTPVASNPEPPKEPEKTAPKPTKKTTPAKKK